MSKKTKLTKEELKLIQELNSEFNKAKIAIGDIELQKQELFQNILRLRIEFSKNEQLLVARYGADALIDIISGEVTTK
jgi:hypothetical protein